MLIFAAVLFALPLDLSVPRAPEIVRANGAQHLLYELHLTNFKQPPLVIRGIAAVDAATGQELESWAAEELPQIIARPGAPDIADKCVIAGGMRAVIFLDIALTDTPPRAIRHHITTDGGVVEGGRTEVLSAVGPIGSPLRGDRWLAMHAFSNGSSHRRTIVVVDGKARIAQRFATDWTRIGPNGLAFHDDPAKLSNWYAYDADVLAVAGGRVAGIHDGVPENDPTSETKAVPITLDTVGGNYVVVDLGQGRFAFYAHLRPGSIRVKMGERVRAGQSLARLGNSGNSDAPHLHFHLMDGPSPLGAEGIPYELHHFDVLGAVASLGMVAEGAGWKPSASPARRRKEIPVENAVVAFP